MPNKMIDLSPGQVLSILCIKTWLRTVGDVADAVPPAVIQRALDGICQKVDRLVLDHDCEEAELTVRNLEQAVLDGSPMVLWANMGPVYFLGFRLFSPSLQQEAALGGLLGGFDMGASRVPRGAFMEDEPQ